MDLEPTLTDDTPTSAQARVDAWKNRADEQLKNIQKMAEKMENLKVGAVNDDNTVKVTVDAAGALVDLKLHEDAMDETADDLAAEIMETLRKARTSLSLGASMVLKSTVGTETETGRAVLETFHKRFGVPGEEASQ